MTEHFTLTEFIQSETALRLNIDNSLPTNLKNSALFTLAGMERIRATLGYPIKVLSGYRCAALNKAIGGVVDNPYTQEIEMSQHEKAEASDFVCPKFGTPMQIAKFLYQKRKMLGIDQLILEGTWLHVSFTPNPRYQVLTLVNGHYVTGIVYRAGV